MAARVRDGSGTGRILLVQFVPGSPETEIMDILRIRWLRFADVAIEWQLVLVPEAEEMVVACGVCWQCGSIAVVVVVAAVVGCLLKGKQEHSEINTNKH